MDFTIKTDGEDDRLRKAFRTKVPGFHVKVEGKVYEVKDLSASGFAVGDTAKALKEGTSTQVSFYLNKKLFLAEVNAEVVRVLDNGIVGFNFMELERRQSIKLDKLVLEIQKRLIELRKKQS